MEMDLKRAELYSLEKPPIMEFPVTQQSPHNVVVIANEAKSVSLGPLPQLMKCPHCEVMMESRIEKRITKQTHLFALGLCLLGLICLAPLPYCLKSCQSGDHFCSQCNRFLGKARS